MPSPLEDVANFSFLDATRVVALAKKYAAEPGVQALLKLADQNVDPDWLLDWHLVRASDNLRVHLRRMVVPGQPVSVSQPLPWPTKDADGIQIDFAGAEWPPEVEEAAFLQALVLVSIQNQRQGAAGVALHPLAAQALHRAGIAPLPRGTVHFFGKPPEWDEPDTVDL